MKVSSSVAAAVAALFMFAVGSGNAIAAPADRGADPVVLKGLDVPGMNGVAPARIVAFRYNGGWKQVPVQVDERKVVSVSSLYPGNPVPPYVIASSLTFDLEVYSDAKTRTGADDDLALDANDEIAFMGSDTGGLVADNSVVAPRGVVADGPSEAVTVTDPVGSGQGHLYLFKSAGLLKPGAGKSYVDYDFKLVNQTEGQSIKDAYRYSNSANPEDSTVSTPFYTLHSTDRWKEDRMEVHAGSASGVDILDREVAQATLTGCGRTEFTFSGTWTAAQRGSDNDEGTYVAVINGPVRAIRSYMGANSGPYVQRDHIYYGQREDNNIYLRVHPMTDLYTWTDFAPEATGMTYRNFRNPAGVTVDGNPDTLTPATTADFQPGMVAWESLDGPQGAVSTLTSVDTDIDPPNFGSYYLDDSTPTASSEKQCGGDLKSFGASGFGILGPITPNTDPRLASPGFEEKKLTVHRTRYFSAPGSGASGAAGLADRVAKPLTATASGFTPAPGSAKLKLMSPKKVRVKAGRKAGFTVRIRNTGTAVARAVVICLKAPGSGSCSSDSRSLAPGKTRTMKMSFRTKKGMKGKRLKLRITARVKGDKDSSPTTGNLELIIK